MEQDSDLLSILHNKSSQLDFYRIYYTKVVIKDVNKVFLFSLEITV